MTMFSGGFWRRMKSRVGWRARRAGVDYTYAVDGRTETLREKQSRFLRMSIALMRCAHNRGYELTYGDAFRDPRCPYGHRASLHHQRLAIDLNIFRDGIYLGNDVDEYRELGEYWESIGGSWGGRFNDGNHFSLAHEGME